MEGTAKKKFRVGLTVLLVLLVLILLLVGCGWLYLSADHFHIAELRAAQPYSETFAGPREYQEQEVTVRLDAAELCWIADTYKLLDVPITNITLHNYGIQLQGTSLFLYLDMTYGDFLPLPLQVEVTLSEADDSLVTLAIKEIRLGKQLPIPMKWLDSFGLSAVNTVDVSKIQKGLEFRALSLKDGLLSVTNSWKKSYTRGIAPDQTADILILYGEEPTTALAAASACYRADGAGVSEAITSAENPAQMVTHLLALSAGEPETSYVEKLSEFEQRYILPVSVEDVKQQREAYLAQTVPYQRQLQNLLNALRSKYSKLEISLTSKGYMDPATGTPLSLSALAPELGLDDADCRLLLLTAIEPKKYPAAAEMPPLSAIPKERGLQLKDTVSTNPYDIGIILPLASGDYAMLYYFSSGELVTHCLPDAEVEAMLKTYAIPRVLNLDNAVYGIHRITRSAPAEGLKDCIFYLPEAVEEVYSANRLQ